MATGELEEMSRRAAALADERDSLMAQLRTQRPIAGRPVVSKKALGKNAVDKENQAPESFSPAGMSFARGETQCAVAEAAIQLLQQAETDRGGETTKIVRFASPLLTPKSNAIARLRAEGPDAVPIAGNVGGASEMREYDEHIALENSTLRALINTKDLELAGLRHQLSKADERAAALLSELGVARQVMGGHEGRELAACKATLKDITNELSQAHHQQRQLEVDRDKSEASLLEQLQTACRNLALVQKSLAHAEEQNQTLTKAAEFTTSELDGLKASFSAVKIANDALTGDIEFLRRTQEEMRTEKHGLETSLQEVQGGRKELQHQLDSLRLKVKDMEESRCNLETKLQNVWFLASKGQHLDFQEDIVTMVGPDVGGNHRPTYPSQKQLIEVKPIETKCNEEFSAQDTLSKCVELMQTDQAYCVHEHDMECDTSGVLDHSLSSAISRTPNRSHTSAHLKEHNQARNRSPCHSPRARSSDSQNKRYSPSSIVDGLQRHIRRLMRSIETQDAQRERLILGMQEQRAKIELLMKQQTEAGLQSGECERLPVQQADHVHEEKDEFVASLSHEIDKLQTVLQSERAAHHGAVSVRDKLVAQVAELTATIEAAEMNNSQLQRNAQERQRECERLKDIIADSQTGLKEAACERERAMQECEIVKQRAMCAERQSDCLTQDLQSLRMEMKRLELESESLRNAAESENIRLSKMNQDSQACVMQLEDEKKVMEERLHQLESQWTCLEETSRSWENNYNNLLAASKIWEASRAKMEGERQLLDDELRKTAEDRDRVLEESQTLAQQHGKASLELQRANKVAAERCKTLEEMREAAETEAEALRAGLVAAAKVEKERNRLQREAQAYEATIEEMKSEIESLQTNLAEKSRNIHELRNIRQEALNLQEETVHLKSEVQRLAKSSTDKARLQEDLADALAKIEELGEEAIKNARLAGERTKLHEKIEKLYEENENAKIESQSLRKAATARDKALGQIEQYLKRIEELEEEARRSSKLLLDKDRLVCDGKSAAAELAEALQHINRLEKCNDALERDAARLNKSVAEMNFQIDDLKDKLETELQRGARTRTEKSASLERAQALEERSEDLLRDVARLNKIMQDKAVEHEQNLEQEVQRFRNTAAELAAMRSEHDMLGMQLGEARMEISRMNEQAAQFKMRARDEEREKNELLEKERERLRKVAEESTWAHNGLNSLTDEHEVLQQELLSLEESLIRKDQTGREQEVEMKRLRTRNEELEHQLQSISTAKSNEMEEMAELAKSLQDRDAARETMLTELQDRLNNTRKSLAEVEGQLRETEVALKNKEAEMTCTIQHKETQIIEFLKAVEVKTAEKDQELLDTRHRLARTEAALSKLMAECASAS